MAISKINHTSESTGNNNENSIIGNRHHADRPVSTRVDAAGDSISPNDRDDLAADSNNDLAITSEACKECNKCLKTDISNKNKDLLDG